MSDANPTSVGINSSATNGSSPHPAEYGDIHIQLLTVVVCSLILFIFGTVGFLANLAVLVSTQCKRSIKCLKYGAIYCLCAVDIILCILWVPLEITCIIRGYVGAGTHPVLCYLRVAVFNFFASVIVCLSASITLQQLYRVWYRHGDRMNSVMVGCGSVTLLLSSLLTLCSCIEYYNKPDFYLCVHGTSQVEYIYATLVFESAMYLVALLATIAAFTIIVLIKHHQIAAKEKKHGSPREENSRKSLKFHEVNCTDLDDSRHNVSDSVPSNEPSSSSMKSSRSKASKKGVGFVGIGKSNGSGDKEDSDEGSDDDQFDLRMMLKMQKSGSGRRHTVANIGLSEGGAGGRRRSLGDRSNSPNALNYQYVRKWSVDITALQQQLENPKLHIQTSPFPELKKFREQHAKQDSSIHSIHEMKEEPNEEEAKDEKVLEKVEEQNVEEAKGEESKPAQSKVEEQKEEEKIEEIDIENDNVNCSTELLPSSPTIPSIVVNGNNNMETNSNQDKCEEECSEVAKLVRENLQSASIYLVLLVLLFTLPYIIVQLLQAFMTVQQNRNWSLMAASVFLIQCPLHPVLLAWKERKIYQALKRLYFNLTHWRCVCYCNIGKSKGKNCFARNCEAATSNPVPVVESAS